jgi:pyridoxamine 5'-phosphate oxidase
MLRDIRNNYEYSSMDEEDILLNPFDQFKSWLNEAIDSEQLEPTAMVLSTVDENQQPQSRVVLLKELKDENFVFYTNYEGNKAQQMEKNSRVSLLFFWPNLERQVRIVGKVEKLDEESATDYFHSRPLKSQLGAWASPQSQVIPSYHFLVKRFHFYEEKFGDQIPKPPHWGGYKVKASSIEFWQGRRSRLHDRLIFNLIENSWIMSRLAP